MQSGDDLKKALDFVTSKIKGNVAIIKDNCAKMKERNVQAQNGLNIADSVDYFSLNNDLLQENRDLLKIQAEISGYIVKYGNNTESEYLSDEDIFKKTIQGELELDENHPLIGDTDFMQKLLLFYQESEQYEKCNVIVKYLK